HLKPRARRTVRRGEGVMAMPHFPHRVSLAILSYVDLRASDSVTPGHCTPIGHSRFNLAFPGQPSQVPLYRDTHVCTVHLFNGKVAVPEILPESGPFIDLVIDVCIEIEPVEFIAAHKDLAHTINMETTVGVEPYGVEPENLLAVLFNIRRCICGHISSLLLITKAFHPSVRPRSISLSTRS